MSGRPTAEIAADLRERQTVLVRIEAADRLTELDALSVEIAKRLLTYSTLRPPCPTCDGKGFVDDDLVDGQPCPDCVDGKVSIEQLVATWRAVWEWAPGWPAMTEQIELIDHLRSVWP